MAQRVIPEKGNKFGKLHNCSSVEPGEFPGHSTDRENPGQPVVSLSWRDKSGSLRQGGKAATVCRHSTGQQRIAHRERRFRRSSQDPFQVFGWVLISTWWRGNYRKPEKKWPKRSRGNNPGDDKGLRIVGFPSDKMESLVIHRALSN